MPIVFFEVSLGDRGDRGDDVFFELSRGDHGDRGESNHVASRRVEASTSMESTDRVLRGVVQ